MECLNYILNENICWDRQDSGGIITINNSENIVCLGKFECELLDIILTNDFNDALQILFAKYQGDTIESDVVDFCEKMCKLGIIQKQES